LVLAIVVSIFAQITSRKYILLMLKKYSFPLVSLLLLSFCAQEKPNIRVTCETTPTGNYLIQWETFPPIAGTVKIYESNNPDSFNLYSPIAEIDIKKGYIDIFAIRNLNRSYFKLVFNNKSHSVITAERVIPMRNLCNFRDLGGYYNENNRQTQWGKLYRSSSLGEAKRPDMEILNRLGIKTVIDFRSEKDRFLNPNKYLSPHIVNLPLRSNPTNLFFDRILSGKMKRGDVLIYLQDITSYLLEYNLDYYTKFFNILSDKNNYPILMNCYMGKDRSGIAAALVLAALDVDWEQIVDDYVLSDELIDYNSVLFNAGSYTPEIQEIMTAMIRTHRETIDYTFRKVIKEYGSINNFMEKELDLTPQKKEKLKEILLYPDIN
jgi:protein-tyrosine phosphatase